MFVCFYVFSNITKGKFYHYTKYFRTWKTFILTLKWSRGSIWTLKSVFARQRENAEYPDAAVSWFFTCLPPRIFWHVFEKKSRRALRGNCVRVPMDPPLTTNGTTVDKNNFPHTRDVWPLVAIHKCGLMILSHINTY